VFCYFLRQSTHTSVKIVKVPGLNEANLTSHNRIRSGLEEYQGEADRLVTRELIRQLTKWAFGKLKFVIIIFSKIWEHFFLYETIILI
jgi:hypothetical protein